MKYCGICYTTPDIKPFGFCEKCWIKHGRPKGMKASIREGNRKKQ